LFYNCSVDFVVYCFSKKKKHIDHSAIRREKSFEREIVETQIEIREEILRNISWELHDNIGQLLTLAKIQLQDTSPESLAEVKQIISRSLQEIRTMSKMINPEYIKKLDLKAHCNLK
jgi:two-component system, NarL family, sensor kinase